MQDNEREVRYDNMTGKPYFVDEVKQPAEAKAPEAVNPYVVPETPVVRRRGEPNAYLGPQTAKKPAARPEVVCSGEQFQGRCAGFFVRLAAYCIDALVASAAAFAVRAAFMLVNADLSNILFSYSLPDILAYIAFTAYFVLLTKLCGTTLGKMAFRLKVVMSDGASISWLTAVYRETIGKYLNSLLCIGYIVLAVDSKKRGIHDMLCDTLVVYSI